MNTTSTLTPPTFKTKPIFLETNKKINYPVNQTQRLLAQYAEQTQYPVETLIGKARQADIMLTRKVIWLKMRKEGYTLKEIADIFNRTHPTLISGICNIEGLLQIKDRKAVEELNKLTTN